jgi:DNA adenine methylase
MVRMPAAEREPTLGTTPKPFIKWAGGKRQLLPHLARHVPPRYGTYHEPFVGGGALFFHLRPQAAVLSDSNERLIRAYRGIKESPAKVIGLLGAYRYERSFHLAMRRMDIDGRSDAEVAAWFIYLNRTSYNGLYRVNSKNRFNVPFGRYANPTICHPDNLMACAAALENAELRLEDFAQVLGRARRGDFVYFDPPYVPLSSTSSFTSYTSGGFGEADQIRLRDTAKELKRRGVHVLLSNSASPFVRELYAGFSRREVGAFRMVNSKTSGRGKIAELLIW